MFVTPEVTAESDWGGIVEALIGVTSLGHNVGLRSTGGLTVLILESLESAWRGMVKPLVEGTVIWLETLWREVHF